MKSIKSKIIFITLLFGVPAFLSERVLWPDAAGIPIPSAIQLPFFIILSIIQSALFGFGIAFVSLFWKKAHSVSLTKGRIVSAVFISLAWLLVSWWPHANFHRAVGNDIQELLYVEYGFHLTNIIASVIVAYGFILQLRRKSDTE